MTSAVGAWPIVSHWVPEERPAETAEALLKFLA
jgi:hypothetical protein